MNSTSASTAASASSAWLSASIAIEISGATRFGATPNWSQPCSAAKACRR